MIPYESIGTNKSLTSTVLLNIDKRGMVCTAEVLTEPSEECVAGYFCPEDLS